MSQAQNAIPKQKASNAEKQKQYRQRRDANSNVPVQPRQKDVLFEALHVIDINVVTTVQKLDDFIESHPTLSNRLGEYKQLNRSTIRNRFYTWINRHKDNEGQKDDQLNNQNDKISENSVGAKSSENGGIKEQSKKVRTLIVKPFQIHFKQRKARSPAQNIDGQPFLSANKRVRELVIDLAVTTKLKNSKSQIRMTSYLMISKICQVRL